MHSVQSAKTVQMPNLWCNVNTLSPNKKKNTKQMFNTNTALLHQWQFTCVLTTRLEATGHAQCRTTMLAPSSAHLSQTIKQKSVLVSVSFAEEPTSRAKKRLRKLRHKNRLMCTFNLVAKRPAWGILCLSKHGHIERRQPYRPHQKDMLPRLRRLEGSG